MRSSLRLSARFMIATAIATGAALMNQNGLANDNAKPPTPTPTTANANKPAKTLIPVPVAAFNKTQILNTPKFQELRKILIDESVRTDLTIKDLNKVAIDDMPKIMRRERVAEVLKEAVKTKLAKPNIMALTSHEISEDDLKKAVEAGVAQPGIVAFVKAELAKPAKPLSAREQVDYALMAMYSSVTPHDGYMPPKKAQEWLEALSATFVGIGVELNINDGKLLITEPIANGPASKVGIKAGDIIIGIDNIDLTKLDPEEAIEKHLRGVEGSKATLKILRDNAPLSFDITRNPVKQRLVEYTMLDGGIAHFQVKHFGKGVAQELRERIAEAKADAKIDPVLSAKGGLKGVVLNFMYNPGGDLYEARQMADDFIDKEGFVVSTEGRDLAHNEILRSKEGDVLNGLPMVVLVNERSASASELVPNALQDHGRAIVMGTPTFGKGTVQTVRSGPDGSAIKITIAQFIRPSGTSNQLVGTIPDIMVDTKDAEYEEQRKNARTERSLPNALKNERGQAEQAARTKFMCAPVSPDAVVPESGRLKGIFNKEGKMNPYVACARDYLLKKADATYASPYTVTTPYQAPVAPAAAPRPNS
ncbi:MAG TPA: S41 family peptidase [Micavibrio sp.]